MYFLTIALNDCDTRVYTESQIHLILASPEDYGIRSFLNHEHAGTDPSYWPEGAALLVKGEVIQPEPVSAVTSWKLP